MSVGVEHLELVTALSYIGPLEGDPAIVLPGGPCRGPEYLGDLAGLGEKCGLVVMHPRGTASSGGLSRGWWADADDVVALMDALGLTDANLVAHSAGTRLALAVATRFPDRVRSMALVTPPAAWLTGTPHDGDAIADPPHEPAVAAALASLRDDEPEDEDQYRDIFAKQAPASYARWTPLEQAHARVGTVSLAAARAWFAGVPRDVSERILAATLPPALVIGGDSDLLTGVQPVKDYAAALHAHLELVADCGHYPWIEQPAAFRRILSSWLARHRRDRSTGSRADEADRTDAGTAGDRPQTPGNLG